MVNSVDGVAFSEREINCSLVQLLFLTHVKFLPTNY